MTFIEDGQKQGWRGDAGRIFGMLQTRQGHFFFDDGLRFVHVTVARRRPPSVAAQMDMRRGVRGCRRRGPKSRRLPRIKNKPTIKPHKVKSNGDKITERFVNTSDADTFRTFHDCLRNRFDRN